MGGNDKRKLTRFIVNNLTPDLASPLAAECSAADLLEVHLPHFEEHCYRRQCALRCGGGEKNLKGANFRYLHTIFQTEQIKKQ